MLPCAFGDCEMQTISVRPLVSLLCTGVSGLTSSVFDKNQTECQESDERDKQEPVRHNGAHKEKHKSNL